LRVVRFEIIPKYFVNWWDEWFLFRLFLFLLLFFFLFTIWIFNFIAFFIDFFFLNRSWLLWRFLNNWGRIRIVFRILFGFSSSSVILEYFIKAYLLVVILNNMLSVAVKRIIKIFDVIIFVRIFFNFIFVGCLFISVHLTLLFSLFSFLVFILLFHQ
jgi:hypothetical protein